MKHTMRILSVFLVLMLCLSMLPVGALASAYSEEVYEAYEAYIYEFLLHELEVNSTMTMEMVEEFMAVVRARDYDVFPADMLYNGMLCSGVAMTIDEFAAQYVPGTGGTYEPPTSGEGEEEEPAPGGSTGIYSEEVYEAYEAYIYEFLLHELEVNSTMTMEQVEEEFMPLIEARDYVSFPVDLLYSGMLNSGVAMTIDEFAAQYVPGTGGTYEPPTSGEGEEEEPAPGGSTGIYSEEVYEAYEAYIYEFLLHELEVNSTMTMEMVEEFMAVVRARDYDVFPADMLYNGMLCSGVAMTIDEFAAQYFPGDLDGNGSLGAGDAVVLMKCILNDSSGPAGDLNDDGATDVQDVIRLIRYLAGENVALN